MASPSTQVTRSAYGLAAGHLDRGPRRVDPGDGEPAFGQADGQAAGAAADVDHQLRAELVDHGDVGVQVAPVVVEDVVELGLLRVGEGGVRFSHPRSLRGTPVVGCAAAVPERPCSRPATLGQTGEMPATAAERPGWWPHFSSPVRSTALTARLGRALGTAFTLCFLTGLLSYTQYLATPGLPKPVVPAWGYRLTQGIHVTTGVASIPLVIDQALVGLPQLVPLASGPVG